MIKYERESLDQPPNVGWTLGITPGVHASVSQRSLLWRSASSSTCCRGWVSNCWTPLALWRSLICR
jgi:hypothetical protein